jgi:Xaa-Pro aminopeptidase
MNGEAIRRRVQAISRKMKKAGMNCLLITKPANVSYTTGFMGEDSWAAVINSRSFLITDSRFTEQAEKECPICNIIERHEPLAEAAAKIIKKYKSVRNVSVENSTSVADYTQIKKAFKMPIKAAGSIIEDIRSVKDKGEYAILQAAADIASEGLAQTVPLIKPGMTESELAGMVDFQIRKLGAMNGFETIVAFGPNASRPHHQPGPRKLKKNDTILIDFGAKYQGYRSDITRCFVVGKPSSYYMKVFGVVEKAQAAAIKLMKAGAPLREVDAAPREVIKQSGLPVYGHGSGHGIGWEIHENPFLKPEATDVLQAGQILTIEPGIYMPNKLGVRLEDDILITETGCKILTKNCPHSPLLI